MSQQQTPVVFQQSKTPATSPLSSAPVPLTSEQLRIVSGGAGARATGPFNGW